MYLVNETAIMNNGAIVQIGTPEEIFKKPVISFDTTVAGTAALMNFSRFCPYSK